VGPRTLELGPEPPAVVNFLVNDFRVTDDAVPATLIDLAARNVVDVEWRGPTSTFGRRSGEPASRTRSSQMPSVVGFRARPSIPSSSWP
jgi:hypothetical protein